MALGPQEPHALQGIAHYQKIIVTLHETICLMKKIDAVIDRHGGWPGACQTGEVQVAAPSVIPFRPRIVQPGPKERYVTCVPLVPLKVAAGAFTDPQHIDDDGFEWVAIETKRRLRPGIFVAQVGGKSMEPAIPDGAYFLFAAPIEGTRQGKVVLVQPRDATDPESGVRTPSNATRERRPRMVISGATQRSPSNPSTPTSNRSSSPSRTRASSR